MYRYYRWHYSRPMTTGQKAAAAVAVALVLGAGGGAATHHHHSHGFSGPVPDGSTYSRTSWVRGFLKAGHFPLTDADVTSMRAWTSREAPWNAAPPDGAEYTRNPMNTSQDEPGSQAINSANIQAYPNWREGFEATLTALNNGLYGDIIAALRSGGGFCGRSLTGFHNWSAGPSGPASAGYWSVC